MPVPVPVPVPVLVLVPASTAAGRACCCDVRCWASLAHAGRSSQVSVSASATVSKHPRTASFPRPDAARVVPPPPSAQADTAGGGEVHAAGAGP